MYGTFISPINSKSLMFNSNIKSLSDEVSPIKRIGYEFENKTLKGKQYFSPILMIKMIILVLNYIILMILN